MSEVLVPTVSVIMNVFNGERYVEQAIGSILAQDFQSWELIIVDDGSSDRTPRILGGYSDPRILIIRNEDNLGIPASVNKGLDIARGKFIARLDADDISFPTRLSYQCEYLSTKANVVLLGCALIPFYSSVEMSSAILPMKTGEDIGYQLLRGNIFKSSATMFRRDVIEAFRLRFNEDFPNAQDYEFWTRLAMVGRVDNISQIVGGYRLHEGQQSKTNSLRQRKLGLTAQRILLARASSTGNFGHWNRLIGRLWSLRHWATLTYRGIQSRREISGP